VKQMTETASSSRVIAYGRANAAHAGPAVTVTDGTPLRLCHGPYPFDEPPDLIRIVTVEDRLDLLREHLQSLCGVWDRPAQGFVAAYFRWIGAAITTGVAELAQLAHSGGGFFSPVDWSYAALRPLPQAHLSAAGVWVRVDFAFWTDAGLVAIDLQGSASPRRQRQEELALLAAHGVVVVAVPGAAQLDRLLPESFHRFWRGVALPSGPFGPQALDVILAEGDQSVASIT